ncbi:hypothetical protein FACS1894195_3870 [Bacteroidia bacterium]|nr:hypothetical protein FACS1894195_3870 [Bacteroidia bacterium]
MNYTKILSYVTIALFAVAIVLLGLFMLGGDVPDQLYTTPVYTGALLYWAYILTIATVVAAVIFPLIRMITRPKDAMKSIIGIVGVVVVILVTYVLADDTILKIPGYSGQDNVPITLKLTDTLLYTIYALFGIVVLAIGGTELYKKFS